MTDKETKILVNNIFDTIKASNDQTDLRTVLDQYEIPSKNRMDPEKYPELAFAITGNEIQALKANGFIDKEMNLTTGISENLNDPLTKLLYATMWKNGDLKKVKHIIQGVLDGVNVNNNKDSALVFYHFGKYLTKLPGQPIIDQHVIRAYAVYQAETEKEIKSLRSLNTLNKSHRSLIRDYKKWIISDELSESLKNNENYTYEIDKILFAAGKTIKVRS